MHRPLLYFLTRILTTRVPTVACNHLQIQLSTSSCDNPIAFIKIYANKEADYHKPLKFQTHTFCKYFDISDNGKKKVPLCPLRGIILESILLGFIRFPVLSTVQH